MIKMTWIGLSFGTAIAAAIALHFKFEILNAWLLSVGLSGFGMMTGRIVDQLDER